MIFCMQIKVLHENQTEPTLYTPSEFQQAMGIQYISQLEFQTPDLQSKITRRCAKALGKNLFGIRQKWLGTYHEKAILAGSMPDLSIYWANSNLGYGVFPNQNLPKNSLVGEYTGIVRKRRRFSDRKNNYCFEYAIGDDPFCHYVIDAEKKSNLIRFVNHSNQPNCEPVAVLAGGLVHIVLVTLIDIPKGTPLTYDYGETYWKNRKAAL